MMKHLENFARWQIQIQDQRSFQSILLLKENALVTEIVLGFMETDAEPSMCFAFNLWWLQTLRLQPTITARYTFVAVKELFFESNLRKILTW